MVALFAAVALGPGTADAQLRIVTYNTTGPPDGNINFVLRAIGEEVRNGIARPIDILLLQEQSNATGLPDTQAFVDLLNLEYLNETFLGEPITYARGTLRGGGDTTQAVVYRTQTVERISETPVGSTSLSGPARQTVRHRLRPVGYGASADFYIYNSHYKASQGIDGPPATTPNATRRENEAITIRNNANGLGEGTHIIFAGDFNFYDSDADEPAWARLTEPGVGAAGNGQAHDPINRVGTWHENFSFADVHTQSPCSSGCGAGGGMDDRFDFQLVTGEFLDGEGLDYIPGSYYAFGNNGTTYNTNINSPSNTVQFTGTTYSRADVLNALRNVTDHIPVVADYQVPAILSAVAGTVPATLLLGEAFQLEVTVSNAAKVVAPNGADELDYSITTDPFGDVTGEYLDQMDFALGGGNVHLFPFDTSTLGFKSGTITVQTSSPAVPVASIPIAVEFLVLSGQIGDYNNDGSVDASDYTVWRNHLGQSGSALFNRDPNYVDEVGEEDYAAWKEHYGDTLFGEGGLALARSANGSVPEPGGWLLAVLGCCFGSCRSGKLRKWTRAT